MCDRFTSGELYLLYFTLVLACFCVFTYVVTECVLMHVM